MIKLFQFTLVMLLKASTKSKIARFLLSTFIVYVGKKIVDICMVSPNNKGYTAGSRRHIDYGFQESFVVN